MKLTLRQARFLLSAALLAALLGLAAAGSSLRELRIRVNDLDFLPADSPVLAADQAIREHFGSDERLIVAFEGIDRRWPEAQFQEDFQFFLRQLTASQNINLLLFDRFFRPRFLPRDAPTEPYFLHPPDRPWLERALAVTAVTGQLGAAKSGNAVFFETPALSASGVARIERQVREAAARLEARRPGSYRVRLLGRHVVQNGLGQAILADLIRLLPWCFLIIAVLFWGIFRSWILVALALFQSGVTVLLALAIQTRLGHPLSLMTAMIPVLVTVLGIADEIHFFSIFLSLRARSPQRPAPELAWESLRSVFFPCTAITLTTMIGFASFWATEAPALQVFGLMAGIGLALSWLVSITLVPAVLALVPIRTGAAASPWHAWRLPRWLLHPWFLIALSVLLVPGILRLRVDDGWTRNFRPDHPIVQDVHWFQQESVGLYQLDLMLERRDGRRWTEPGELAALERLQRELDARPELTASLSLADLVRDRSWELAPTLPERPPLPADRPQIERLLTTYRLFNEQILARMFLDRPETATRLILGVASDDYLTATRARKAVDRAVRRAFPSGAVAAWVGGSAERGRVLIASIVANQRASVLLSLVLSLLVLGCASGRWGRSLRCLAVNVWALLLVLGGSGWLGLELGVASSSFLALGIGVGLDYGIHLGFHAGTTATADVIRRVAANVFVVSVGLSVLALSANPSIARLGLLIVASLVASGYTAIVVFSWEKGGPASAEFPAEQGPPVEGGAANVPSSRRGASKGKG